MVEQVCKRHKCCVCRNPATHQMKFLLKDARTNSASEAYGGGDTSWCCDKMLFVCQRCEDQRDLLAAQLGMMWQSSVLLSHKKLFYWKELEEMEKYGQ